MRIGLYGYGKMGKAIEQVAKDRGHQVPLIVDADHAGTPPADVDVVIEFSRPDAALRNMELCFAAGVPIVVGTTGWYDQFPKVRQMLEEHNGTMLWASNFSIGVNLFFRLNKYLAALMDPRSAYTASLHEIHHVHKLDAPSGTAITLARDIDLASQRYTGWELDPSMAPSTPGPLPIHSERLGEVPGTHAITWASPEDRITITHEAFGRQGFATGAVFAAEWLQGRNGLFTMDNVLDIRS